MKPSDFKAGVPYAEYLQAIRKCGFCGGICVMAEPECCDLARGLNAEQVDRISKLAEERMTYYMRLADIACISCNELSPVMRRTAARIDSDGKDLNHEVSK